MVQYECPEYSQLKSAICRPKDNIGISCTFSQENIMKQPTTGIRRKYHGPKDNLGIACLPTMIQAMKLRDIPEISEDSSGETRTNSDLDPSTGVTPSPAERKVRFARTKITGRARCNIPTDNLQSSCRHVDKGVKMAHFRLCGGGDHVGEVTRGKIRSKSDKCGRSKIEWPAQVEQKYDVGHIGHQIVETEQKLPSSSKKAQRKPTPPDVGISNIRRPKHDPTLPRKPIVPKDNIGFSGCHLQRPSNQTIGSTTSSATYSMRKMSRASDERKTSSQMSLTHSSFWQNPTRNKSLKATKVSGISKGTENGDE